MIFEEKEILLKDGRKCILRSAAPKDAEALIEYLKITAAETPYLLREPEEANITLEREEYILAQFEKVPRELMLIAEIDGRHAGNCSLSSIGRKSRVSHRCGVAIALYREYCHMGIGKAMLTEILETAKNCGYEQAELEVVTSNLPAIGLYQKMGFIIHGTRPHSMKYKDGSYADEYFMVKSLS